MNEPTTPAPAKTEIVNSPSVPPEVLAIGSLVQPFAEAMAKNAELQAQAAIKTAQIKAEADKTNARQAHQWNMGVLIIIALIAIAAIATLFTGQVGTGEKLLFGVLGFFGGIAINHARKPD